MAHAPPARRARIVVLDDDPHLVSVLRSWLSSLGFDVMGLTSVPDAVAHLGAGNVDVVVTGAHLVGAGASSLGAILRKAAGASKVGLVALARPCEGAVCHDPSFDVVLDRPVPLDMLLCAIAEAVPGALPLEPGV